MKANEIINTITRTLNKGNFKIQKHSPEILVVTGIIGVVGAAVMACKATTKADDIIVEHNERMDTIHKVSEMESEEYSLEDVKKDTAIVYTQTAVKFCKLYGPSVLLGVTSIAAILAGHNILHKRNVALAAAYATIDKGFKEYRSRVVERFGKELDKELRYNIKAKEFEKVLVDEKTGKEEVKKETVSVAELNEYSEYSKFYDDGCKGWTKDPELNRMFLMQIQNYANDKLQKKGYLFLNEVYEMLGIPKTKAGQIVGWIYDEVNPIGDNYVDFGLYDTSREKTRDFVNGYERTVLLDFNVDGNILDNM